MSNWITNVYNFVDGVDTLSAGSINPVINTLAERDEYLFEQINNIAAETMLIATNQTLDSSLAVNSFGIPVYFDTTSGQPVLKMALSSYTAATNDGHLFPSPSSYVFGIVKQIYSGSGNDGIYYGDVYVKGLINDPNIVYYNLLDSYSQSNISTLSPGPLFLSSKEAGRLTIYPSGAAIFIGYYLGGSSFVLAPNIDSLNQLYFNYRLYLNPVAAGTVTGSGTLSITSPNITELGWITAAQATSLLGITPPSGALFYYNIPTDANLTAAYNADTLTQEQTQQAFLLKKALPAHPASYALLFVNGVLQTEYDTDHTGGTYIIDDNGVWWTTANSSYVPWGSGITVQLFITKLNPTLAASVVTSLTSVNDAILITDTNNLAASTGDLELALNLGVGLTTTNTGIGNAVQSLSFESSSGTLIGNIAPVINTITVGPGLTYGNTAGQATISLSNFSLSGEVTNIEPQEADFVYKGLHSYLRLKRPLPNQQIGFIGKLLIPDSIPAGTNLFLTLIGFTETGSSSGSAYVSFEFDYAASNIGTSISTAMITSTVYTLGSNFPTLVQADISTGYINAISGSPVTCFVIPSSNFTAGSYVNFRISRTYDTAATYANPVGILGVTWQIS